MINGESTDHSMALCLCDRFYFHSRADSHHGFDNVTGVRTGTADDFTHAIRRKYAYFSNLLTIWLSLALTSMIITSGLVGSD